MWVEGLSHVGGYDRINRRRLPAHVGAGFDVLHFLHNAVSPVHLSMHTMQGLQRDWSGNSLLLLPIRDS